MSVPFILIFIHTHIYGMPVKCQACEAAMTKQRCTRQGGIKYIPYPDEVYILVEDKDINNQ